MRLGSMLYKPQTPEAIETVVPMLDIYGLSALAAPFDLADRPIDDCIAFGERARELGVVVAETNAKPNLMNPDREVRDSRIETLRATLRRADAMQCHGVIVLVGTLSEEDHLAAPHPYMYTEECQREFREIVLRGVDGLELKHTKLLIEPWPTSFFYRPEAIADFLASVDHPSVALHLDLANMLDQYSYFRTTELIDETFRLLTPYIHGVHFKDILWDWRHMLLKFDEVPVGLGVIDYHSFVRHVAALEGDTLCFCEHLRDEAEYAVSIARLHRIAAEVGASFTARKAAEVESLATV